MIKIIADVPWEGDPLTASVQKNGWIGGSEQEVNVFRKLLTQEVPIIQSKEADFSNLSSTDFYIVYNFFLLQEDIKKLLTAWGNYIIIEHDFKFCPGRVPNAYPDMLVPKNEIRNVNFYLGARKVFCLTENQANIFRLNIPELDVSVLGTSFWSEEELLLLKECNDVHSQLSIPSIGAVYNHLPNTKGTQAGINWCNENNHSILLLNPAPKKEFLYTLSLASKLIFLPIITESFSRISAEARMIGLDMVYNNNVSFMLQPGIKEIRGIDLINLFRQELMPRAIETILSYT